MKTGFTTGMVIGGVVGAMIYMVSNGDMNMKRTKTHHANGQRYV